MLADSDMLFTKFYLLFSKKIYKITHIQTKSECIKVGITNF